MNPLRVSNLGEIPPLGGSLKIFAFAAIVAVAGLAAAPAEAARSGQGAVKAAKGKITAVAAKDPETTSSIQSDADLDENCASARRRLFVEGEGWIVRRVTTCY